MYRNRGFTLIELVVVIIILGILAVTAAPKFLDLKGDAVKAQLAGLQGSLKSANAMVRAKSLIEGVQNTPSATITVNGDTVATTYGYIAAAEDELLKVLEGDFVKTTTPGASWGLFDGLAGVITFLPPGYSMGGNCHLVYNFTAPPGVQEPVYRLTDTGC